MTKIGYTRLTVAAVTPDDINFAPAHLACPLVIVDEADRLSITSLEGNFRLLERLFAQMRRIMDLNSVEEVSADIVQAARDCLVIGPGSRDQHSQLLAGTRSEEP